MIASSRDPGSGRPNNLLSTCSPGTLLTLKNNNVSIRNPKLPTANTTTAPCFAAVSAPPTRPPAPSGRSCFVFAFPLRSRGRGGYSLGMVKVQPSSSGVISIWQPSRELSSSPARARASTAGYLSGEGGNGCAQTRAPARLLPADAGRQQGRKAQQQAAADEQAAADKRPHGPQPRRCVCKGSRRCP